MNVNIMTKIVSFIIGLLCMLQQCNAMNSKISTSVVPSLPKIEDEIGERGVRSIRYQLKEPFLALLASSEFTTKVEFKKRVSAVVEALDQFKQEIEPENIPAVLRSVQPVVPVVSPMPSENPLSKPEPVTAPVISPPADMPVTVATAPSSPEIPVTPVQPPVEPATPMPITPPSTPPEIPPIAAPVQPPAMSAATTPMSETALMPVATPVPLPISPTPPAPHEPVSADMGVESGADASMMTYTADGDVVAEQEEAVESMDAPTTMNSDMLNGMMPSMPTTDMEMPAPTDVMGSRNGSMGGMPAMQ